MAGWPRVLAVGVVLAVSPGAVAPAGAEQLPGSFNDQFVSFPVEVTGSYVPLAGSYCGGAGLTDADIVWYGPGTAPDYLWDLEFTPDHHVSHRSRPVTVDGFYEPVVGDFDGNGCDDIFWYHHHGGSYLWYGDPGGFQSLPERRILGEGSRPVVGNFVGDGASGDEIFWYRPGDGLEFIWYGTGVRGQFDSLTAPQVGGLDYDVTSWGSGRILFYRPGTGPDYIWENVVAGASAPGASIRTEINGTYQPHPVSGGSGVSMLLYGPGTAIDRQIAGYRSTGELITHDATINGNYRVSVLPPTSPAWLVVFHAPGPEPDYLWASKEHLRNG